MAAGVAVLVALNARYQGFREPVILDFPKGTSTRAMAQELAQNGVIRYSWQFLAARALHPGKRLQAGEYQFAHADTPSDIFDRIARGDVFYYELAVPEGSNMFDIAASLGPVRFSETTRLPARRPRIPRSSAISRRRRPRSKAICFPSTYRITRSTTVQQLCAMMTGQFRKQWRQLQDPRTRGPVNETVTLASLVEKETAGRERAADRRVGLRKPAAARAWRSIAIPPPSTRRCWMQRYRGAIYRSDLASDNAYNTYQHAGLPPGPIANPGVASLKAALAPAQTDYSVFCRQAGRFRRPSILRNDGGA